MGYQGALREAMILGWVFLGVLLLLAVASTLAARGILRRNHGFGIRLPSLFVSDEAWQRGHAAAVRPSWAGFIVAAVANAVAVFEPVVYWVTIAVFVATVISALTGAARAARRAG